MEIYKDMNKICTSIDQSQRLIELGIDVSTADMCWCSRKLQWGEITKTIIAYPMLPNEEKSGGYEYSPAWSLAALLGLMPKLYEFENDPDDGGCQPNLCKGWDNNKWHVVYRSSIYITEWYEDPVDAAFEMVCWLLENGKL